MVKRRQKKTNEQSSFDDTDRKIVNALLRDGRLSMREVASAVKISGATAMHRIKRLEKDGLIRSYSATIDYEKAGFDVEVMIEVRISKSKMYEVESKIATHPNVFAVYDITGSFDCAIFARFQNRRAMDAFLKKLQTYEFVERTETKLILKTIKEGAVAL